MKKIAFSLLIALGLTLNNQAQNSLFNQDFESSDTGKDVTKLQNKKMNAWGDAIWTITEQKGKGFNKSNKFASSGNEENATLVLYKNLEVGATYIFSAAVKVTGTDVDWKTNYTVKASSGKKGDIHHYKKIELKEPGANKWQKHEVKFTVIEGREQVMLQVYRWAKDVTLNVDDFKLVKK